MLGPGALASRRVPGASMRPRWSFKSDGALVGIAAAVVGALSFWLADFVSRPIVLSVETGFVLDAVRIREGRLPTGSGPGYSLLLSSAVHSGRSLTGIATSVHAVNAILSVGAFYLLFRLCRAIRPLATTRRCVAVAAMAVLAPAYRLYASAAISENIVLVLTLLVALAVIAHSRDRSLRSAAFLVISAGSVAIFDQRAVVITVATVVAVVWSRPDRWKLVASATVLMGVVTWGATRWLQVDAPVSRIDADVARLSGTASGLEDLSLVWAAPLQAASRLLDFSVGSLGIGLLGVCAVVMTVFMRNSGWQHALDVESAPPDFVVARYLSVLTVLALVATAVSVNPSLVEWNLGGPFFDVVLAPAVLIGFVELTDRSSAATSRARPAIGFIVLASLVLGVLGDPHRLHVAADLVDSAGIFPVLWFDGVVRLSTIVVVGSLAVAMVVFTFASSPKAGSALVVVLFGFGSIVNASEAADVAEGLDRETLLVPALSSFAENSGIECIAVDVPESGTWWSPDNLRLEVLGVDFPDWDPSGGEEPCSSFVLSRRSDLDAAWGGAVLATLDSSIGWSLWIDDVGVADDWLLDEYFDLLLIDPDQELPADQALDVALDVDSNAPVAPGARITGTVSLTNRGPAVLLPVASFTSNVGMIGVGIEWRTPDEPAVRRGEPARLLLEGPLRPGETTVLPFSIGAADANGWLFPGDYVLHVEIVQEEVAWTGFADNVAVVVSREGQ